MTEMGKGGWGGDIEAHNTHNIAGTLLYVENETRYPKPSTRTPKPNPKMRLFLALPIKAAPSLDVIPVVGHPITALALV